MATVKETVPHTFPRAPGEIRSLPREKGLHGRNLTQRRIIADLSKGWHPQPVQYQDVFSGTGVAEDSEIWEGKTMVLGKNF